MDVRSRVINRFSAGLVQAYDFSTGAVMASDVVPTAAFPVTDAAILKPDSCAVAPDLSRAVYATPSRVTCIDRDGATLWQLDFPPASSERPNAYNRCDFSLDGTAVWVYRPDAIARNGAGTDRWLAVNADTGHILAQARGGVVPSDTSSTRTPARSATRSTHRRRTSTTSNRLAMVPGSAPPTTGGSDATP